MVDPGELAQRIERADKGRVIGRLCRISDRGGQAVAPMMPVVFAQGRVPIVEAAEQVEMARYRGPVGQGKPTAVSRQNRLHFNNIM